MTNPWLKRNPFLSMWFTGANRMFGVARGQASAEAARQFARMQAQAARQLTDFWMDVLVPPSAPKRRASKRTR